MFAFVCPIRHPATSNNYDEVLSLLKLTITSVCAQNTNEDFIFVVVCNEVPNIELTAQQQQKVVFLPVDFTPSDTNKGTAVPLDAVKFDKGTKTTRGLLYLKAHKPDYVFIMDGDDWINTNIIETTKNKNVDLWYSNSGYIVNYKNQTYIKKYGVCRYCGSTFIYKYDTLMALTGVDKITDEQPSQALIAEQLDDHLLTNILGNHRHQLAFYQERNLVVKEIPIPTVGWILNTGENHTGKDGGVHGLPLTPKFLNTFGVNHISLQPQNIDFKSTLLTKVDSFKSWGGWVFTDKKAYKV